MNEPDSDPRIPLLVGVAGAAIALVSLPLAAAAGAPYLSLADVNPFVVAFLVGVFTLLFAGPFVIERRLAGRVPDRDARWERALLIWGGICAVVLVLALVVGAAADFSGGSLAGPPGSWSRSPPASSKRRWSSGCSRASPAGKPQRRRARPRAARRWRWRRFPPSGVGLPAARALAVDRRLTARRASRS